MPLHQLFIRSLVAFFICLVVTHWLPEMILFPTGLNPTPEPAWLKSELYFGMSLPNGKPLPSEDWEQFVQSEIAIRFPEGFTTLSGRGQWMNHEGSIQQEDSRLLVIYHPDTQENNQKLEDLRSHWCQLHDQESVLKITCQVEGSF